MRERGVELWEDAEVVGVTRAQPDAGTNGANGHVALVSGGAAAAKGGSADAAGQALHGSEGEGRAANGGGGSATHASPAGPSGGGSVELQLRDGRRVACDEVLWCTQASAAPWLAATQLPTDAQGFLAVNECLQSEGGPPEVFAAGDIASCRWDTRGQPDKGP